MRYKRKGWAVAIAAIVGAALAGQAQPAMADQSFVCGDGSIVTVALKDLARMKRTNACVARYFPALNNGEKQQNRVSDGHTTAVATVSVPPLPEQSPRHAKHAARLQQDATDEPTAVTVDAHGVETRIIETGSVRPVGKVAGSATVQPPSDYRRVHILNAPADSAQYYHHTR